MASKSGRKFRAENGPDGGLAEFAARYSDEEACERRLLDELNPGGWSCPRCGCRTCPGVSGRPRKWQRARCSRRFSVTSGTAMARSHMPLAAWFLAFYLVAHSKRGISAPGLARRLGVCEKTGGFMLLRIGGAMHGSGRL